MRIRSEIRADFPAIRDVNIRAFGGSAEADLVERLRRDGQAIVSLVADEGGVVSGHILFSRLSIAADPESPGIPAASLAPLAVAPERQGRGLGSMLVRAGLEACRQKGERIVIVVGHPDYYPRFGFSHGLAVNLRNRYAAGPSFMALELGPGALDGVRGDVRYPPAFDSLT